MFQFRPVEQFLSSPELGDYHTCGIRAVTVSPAGSTDVLFISDISCNLEFVSCLADRCTRLQLDPIHLFDVVLDALP